MTRARSFIGAPSGPFATRSPRRHRRKLPTSRVGRRHRPAGQLEQGRIEPRSIEPDRRRTTACGRAAIGAVGQPEPGPAAGLDPHRRDWLGHGADRGRIEAQPAQGVGRRRRREDAGRPPAPGGHPLKDDDLMAQPAPSRAAIAARPGRPRHATSACSTLTRGLSDDGRDGVAMAKESVKDPDRGQARCSAAARRPRGPGRPAARTAGRRCGCSDCGSGHGRATTPRARSSGFRSRSLTTTPSRATRAISAGAGRPPRAVPGDGGRASNGRCRRPGPARRGAVHRQPQGAGRGSRPGPAGSCNAAATTSRPAVEGGDRSVAAHAGRSLGQGCQRGCRRRPCPRRSASGRRRPVPVRRSPAALSATPPSQRLTRPRSRRLPARAPGSSRGPSSSSGASSRRSILVAGSTHCARDSRELVYLALAYGAR